MFGTKESGGGEIDLGRLPLAWRVAFLRRSHLIMLQLTDQINNARFLRKRQDNTSTPTEGEKEKKERENPPTEPPNNSQLT